jgi:DNA-binding transcriptional MerR regulator
MPASSYSTAQAAQAAGVSSSTIRNVSSGPFTAYYAPFLSPGARPGKGQARQFSQDDIRILVYIRQQTAAGLAHADVAQKLAAGALQDFDWQPDARPDGVRADHPQSEADQGTAALVKPEPGAALVLASAMSAELAQYRTTTSGLTAALVDVTRQLARAEARLQAREEDLQAREEELQYLRQQADNAAIVARLEAELADVRRPIGLLAKLLGYR